MNQQEKVNKLATRIMGWEVNRKIDGWGRPYYIFIDRGSGNRAAYKWNPYKNIAHAWMIIDRMRELGYMWILGYIAETGCEIGCEFGKPKSKTNLENMATATEAWVAISEAALMTIAEAK